MELAGYWMERGCAPEKILALSHEDRLIFRSIMELNREQQKKELEEVLHNTLAGSLGDILYGALVQFWNDINRK